MTEIEKKWLEAVGSLGEDLKNKGMGDLFLETLLVATNLPLISAELRQKSNLSQKLQDLREELNKREQTIAIGFKILREKGLI